MQLEGGIVNPRSDVETLIESLANPVFLVRRQKLLKRMDEILSRPEPKRQKLRLPQGAITYMIRCVMAEAQKPLSIKVIHGRVEHELGCNVSYDTVTSYLTKSARNPKVSGIHRMNEGIYLKAPKS